MKKRVAKLIMLTLILCFSINCAIAEEHVHTWDSGKAATCTEAGYERKCTACGKVEGIIAAHHTWDSGKAATCTEAGYERKCTACGKVEGIIAAHHTWDSGKAATCTEAGYERKCTACGKVEGIIAAHHTWDSGKAATCTEAGYERKCTACGKVEGIIAVKGHTEELLPGKAVTCTETGLTEGKKCSVCGVILKAQETIPATGHTEETVAGKAATCTETGLTEGKKCSVCGVILKAQEVIPAKGHAEEIIPGKAATCTETGLTEGKKCSVCGVILKAQEVIPAKGHAEEIIPGKAATCTETGLTEGKKCSVCGVILKAQETIPATGHQYVTRRIAPTTTAKGYTKHTCTVCGDSYKDNWKAMLAAEATTAEPQTGLYGNIVTNMSRDAMAYECRIDTLGDDTQQAEDRNNLLEIVAEADADGSYALRNLHLSMEMLEQLKTDGIEYIRFINGHATLLIPLEMFEGEDVGLIVADVEQATGYVITVDPNALTEENATGFQVQVMLTNTEDDEMDVTAFVYGMTLTVGENTIEVNENTVYTFQ